MEVRQPAYTPPGSTTPITPVTKRSYNAAGDLRQETDPRGGVTDYTVDVAGRVVKSKAR